MGEQCERRRIGLGLECEIVEDAILADGTRRILAEADTADGMPRMRVEFSFGPETDAEDMPTTQEQIDARIVVAMRRALGRASGLAIMHKLHTPPAGPTVRDLGTIPRVGHDDPAKILAELVEEKSEAMAMAHGPRWLASILASEFRSVYADGEKKGYERRLEDERAERARKDGRQ